MLQHLCAAHPKLGATSLRFPMLVNEQMLSRFESIRSLSHNWFNFSECTSHLTYDDAAELVVAIIQKGSPGYRQYFPAQAMQFKGRSTADLIRQFFPDTPLHKPIEEIAELIDHAEITRETGWRPTRRILVPIED